MHACAGAADARSQQQDAAAGASASAAVSGARATPISTAPAVATKNFVFPDFAAKKKAFAEKKKAFTDHVNQWIASHTCTSVVGLAQATPELSSLAAAVQV